MNHPLYVNLYGVVVPIIPIFMIDLNRKLTIKKNEVIEKSTKKNRFGCANSRRPLHLNYLFSCLD